MMNKISKRISIKKSEGGFTIVEILVALAISGIVMAGIYSAYYTQQRSYEVQEQVVSIQQNLRAAMYFMEREVRMAGLDPEKNPSGDFAIKTPLADTLRFSEDISDDPTDDDDGDGNNDDEPDGTLQSREDITYAINLNKSLIRITGLGTADESTQTLAENIEALDFVYLNSNGVVIPQPIDAATIGNIASVQIAMVAKSERPDPQYSSTQSFTNMQGELLGTTYTDKYRREVLTAQVKCRNIGMD